MPNPNNAKPSTQQQSYSIGLYDIHLWPRMTLARPQQPIIMEVDDTSAESIQEPTTNTSPIKIKPLFLGRLAEQPPLVENQAILDFLE